MKLTAKLLLPLLSLHFASAQAVCVTNETDFKLYYEIQNQNTGCPVPKERFHSGYLNAHEKRCHAHSQSEGDDWKIYRKDVITVYKMDQNGRQLACNKQVEGILNFLEVSYLANRWWCLDRSDYED
ncbi:hypothetical protein GH742_06910 [Legionella sp. MW5194]|uniref:hypothetical protein n=1 Tax=Legionella sp. MW5194 TaxID=2662448 RepID=UPI00193DA64F|nr:hypothetical protein [Legionella sp. MW5194]QRN03614.1 hypothetical protein GH742_06910 [Legionella sp. MW5194]